MVWSDPDTRKATARYLCLRPTTQPLYQGAGKPELQDKLSNTWQILHDRALKIEAEFSLLFHLGIFTFRNIAHGKKRSCI